MVEKILNETNKKGFDKIDKEDRKKIIDKIIIERKLVFDALDD